MQPRLLAATGSSENHDPVEAGRAAAMQALAGLNGVPPALIVVYLSVRYDLPTLLGAVRSVTGDTPLVGATSAGHFRGADLTEPARGVAVLAMTAGSYRFGLAEASGLSDDAMTAGSELVRAARAAAGPEPRPYATLLRFADVMAPEQQALVTGIHHVTGTAVPVVGGGAADDRRLQGTYVLYNDRVLTDTAVAVWIASDHPLPVKVGHGWHA